jgi:hypothetical protein
MSCNVERSRVFTIKLDIDAGYSPAVAELVKIIKDYTLIGLGFRVLGSYCHPSRNGNMHYRALVEAPDEFTEHQVALLQLMLGDDLDRASLNVERTRMGIYPAWGWNMLDIPPREVREGHVSGKVQGRG